MTKGGSHFWSSGSVPLIEPEFLRSIIAAASDIALVVSRACIVESVLINANDTSYGNLDHWEGRRIQQFLTLESVPKFEAAVKRFVDGEEHLRPIELNHSDNAVWEFPIRYSFHRIGTDGQILMLGRDLRLIAETQQHLVQAQMALERGYEARREFDSRYRLLLSTTRDAIVFVSVGTGRIKDINDPAASLLGASRDDLTGATFAQEFKDKRSGEFVESLVNLAISESISDLEVQTRRSRKRVTITPTVFRAGGERVLICRMDPGEDARVVDDQLSMNLSTLYHNGADAVVFTDAKGVIAAANDSFLNMADAAHMSDVKGRSLSDFLARGQIDLNVLIDNAQRSGNMRMYATQLVNDYGGKVAIEVATTWLNDRSSPAIAFVLRDVSRVDAVRKPVATVDEGSQHSVMELVGSATLKEIVAETTDVVEKMCIETAVTLTRNNRVAAAEMLGLSRQSLYVKLRKYGLLSKDGED
ncbi:MAG: transcriptional regulator PpsR [Rhodobacterales bacterium 34-62-10]|nr:MAG: transcriptional regulator PpsR [Rhodobacterales bacterium 34-62-10]